MPLVRPAVVRFWALIVVVAMFGVQAQAGMLDNFKDPDDGWIDMSDWVLSNTTGFMPLPIIITEPALGAGLGAAALFFHPPKEAAEEGTETDFVLPSITAVAGAATTNGTWFVGGGHFGTFKKDTIRYSGFAGYASVNLETYTPSTQFSDDTGFKFNSEGVFVSQELVFRFKKTRWFFGVEQELMAMETEFDLGGSIPGLSPAKEKITSSALGINVQYENVDSLFTPSEGLKAKVSYDRYDEAFGGDFDADKVSAHLYKYWRFSKVWNLGVRLDGKFTDGDLPFYQLPYIDLRGIPALRYADEAVVLGESELRWQFHPRISALVFAGIGYAGESAGDLNDTPSRVTKGVGIRYYAAKQLGMHMGIDIARGPEETAYYLTFGSAWR